MGQPRLWQNPLLASTSNGWTGAGQESDRLVGGFPHCYYREMGSARVPPYSPGTNVGNQHPSLAIPVVADILLLETFRMLDFLGTSSPTRPDSLMYH